MLLRRFSSLSKKAVSDNMRLKPSEKAKICFDCPLPAKKCNLRSCKRYEEEIKKLRREK